MRCQLQWLGGLGTCWGFDAISFVFGLVCALSLKLQPSPERIQFFWFFGFVFWCLAFINPIHQTINKLWFLYSKTQFEKKWKQYKHNHIGMQCRNAAPFLKTELQTVRAPRHPEMSVMSIFKNFRFKLVRQTAANTFWTNGKSWQTPNSSGLLLISGENVLPMFVLKSSSSQSRRNQRCHPSWNQRRSKNEIG